MPVKPQIKSFLIADQVLQEKGTNKWSAIGIFDTIYASSFPCVHPSLALYIRLSDGEGDFDIKVEFYDEAERALAIFKGFKLVVRDRLANPDFGIQTKSLPVPQPGRYTFRLYFNDEFAQSIPINVVPITPKSVGGGA